jgi:predicted TIM-barrel fold metal-dependent hydrolase
MMQFVHEALVGQLSQDEQQQYNLDGKVDKPFILSDLCSWLSNHALRRADNRDALVPQAKWVELALARLVRIDWVSRDPAKHGAFVYHHRKGRKGANDPYGRFIDVCAKELSREQDKARRAEQKAVARMQASDEKFRKEHPLLADLPAPPQREGS